MKRTKTALIIIGLLLAFSIIFYFVPVSTILSRIPFVKDFYNNTTLSINSKNGESEVTINGKSYGETPLELSDLPSGEYTVVLEKSSESKDFYKDHSFDIYLSQNTESRIDIEIGPNDLLHGVVLYYTAIPKGSNDTGLLTITSSPLDADIKMDGEYTSSSPLTGYELTAGQYSITISKDGYEDVEAPVIIREGYHLNVRAFLMPIPLTLETAEDGN